MVGKTGGTVHAGTSHNKNLLRTFALLPGAQEENLQDGEWRTSLQRVRPHRAMYNALRPVDAQ